MLQRLGRNLTLLNLLISGAILIVMALVVLAFSEQTLAEKYESDLLTFSDTALSILLRETDDSASPNVYVQTGGSYIVAQEDGEKQLHLLTGSSIDMEELQETTRQIRRDLETALTQAQVYTIEIRADDELQQGNALFITMTGSHMDTASEDVDAVELTETQVQIAEIDNIAITAVGDEQEASDVATQDVTFAFSAVQTSTEQVTLGGIPYRVLATMAAETEDLSPASLAGGEMLFILQDRTEEIRSRNQQRLLFALLVLGGLGLIYLASRFLSSRSIRPIETSIRQQREFVAAASHELRTPIAAIRANAEVLEDASLSEDFLPFLESIQSEGQRMTRLVGDLIDLARADAGEWTMMPTTVYIQEFLTEAAQLVRPLCEKAGLRLVLEELPAVAITADAERLRQVLMALLDNAMAYTPAGGSIWLGAEAGAHHVELHVSDSGIGIADEAKPRVFDRFFRADAARTRAQGGSGLGLSVAQQWTRMMDGSILVADRPGGGTVFTLRFPRKAEG